jgi:hypothetical protein
LTNSHRLRLLAALAPALVAVGAIGASGGPAFAATATAKPDSQALFSTDGTPVPLQALANARTIPHFTFNFTDPSNGVTYPITMVGANPNLNTSTTIHTEIIPLKMNFVAGNQDTSILNDLGYAGFRATPQTHTFDGSSKVAATLASPVFQNSVMPTDMGGDHAQLGDAFMRAQFNKIASSYHVRLTNDAVLPTQVLDVPANQGLAYVRPVPAWRVAHGLQSTPDLTGVANVSWFSAQLQNMMNNLHIDSATLPIFLTDNVLLYIGQGNYVNCCILGYHGSGAEMPNSHGGGDINSNGAAKVQTYMYAAYTTPGTYSGYETDYTGSRTDPRPTRGLADIHALSHEVSEWLDDPFTNNAVTPWLTPTAPQYGCTRLLETGDPVVGVWFPISQPANTFTFPNDSNSHGLWHPEDEVFAQWFGRGGVENVFGPSYDGDLTFMGERTTDIGGPYAGFGSYAQGC